MPLSCSLRLSVSVRWFVTSRCSTETVTYSVGSCKLCARVRFTVGTHRNSVPILSRPHVLHARRCVNRKLTLVFTTRRYTSVIYAVVACLHTCLRLSHGIVSKRLNFGLRKQRNEITHRLVFWSQRSLAKFGLGNPNDSRYTRADKPCLKGTRLRLVTHFSILGPHSYLVNG